MVCVFMLLWLIILNTLISGILAGVSEEFVVVVFIIGVVIGYVIRELGIV